MTPELEIRRRMLLVVYRRYIAADREWRQAQREAVSWFPVASPRRVPPIGDPGSRGRRLRDRRDRAVDQLAVAMLKLNEARRRLARRVQVLGLPPR